MAVKWPFSINTDSSQARSFQHNTCPGSKLRGCFDLRDKSVSELRDKGVVTSNKIHRGLNVADMLTKDATKAVRETLLGMMPFSFDVRPSEKQLQISLLEEAG